MPSSEQRYYYKQNRLKQLRAFCYAAQTGSISRAAELMFLSQPSVSLLVKALETDLDTILFERSGPRIRLTSEGRIMQELAQPLVESLESLPEVFTERCTQQVAGELHIAAGESSMLYILPDIVQRYRREYPEVRFHLHSVAGRDALGMLRANEADLAVTSMLDAPEDITYRPIFSYDPILLTPLDHPLNELDEISLEQIAEYGLIMPPRHLATARLTDLVFQQHALDCRISMEASGWEIIKEYVTRGLGIAIVSSLCLTGDERLRVTRLDRYFPKRTYGAILRKGKYLSPAARHFVELLEAGAGADRETSLEERLRACKPDHHPL